MSTSALDLLLKFSGDSSEAVGATQEVTSALKTMADSVGAGAAGSTMAIGGNFDYLKSSAADTATQTSSSFRDMWDNMTAKGYNAVSDFGEQVQHFGDDVTTFIKRPLEGTANYIHKVLDELGPFGAGLAAIGGAASAVGYELFHLAEGAAETGEGILAFSRVTGTAVEKVGALSAAAQIGGSSLEGLQSMLTQMQRRLDAGGPAADKMNKALADLSINAEAFRAADPTDRLRMLSEGLQGAAGSTHLMSDALAIMGRSGVTNLPFLMKGVDDLIDRGEKLGYQWSAVDTKAAEDFEIATKSLTVEFSTMATMVGVMLMPAITAIVDGIVKAAPVIVASGAVIGGAFLAMFSPFIAGAAAIGGFALLIDHVANSNAAAASSAQALASQQEQAARMFAQAAKQGMSAGDAAYYVANKMLVAGQTAAVVAAQTGLTVEAVKALKKSMDDAVTAGDKYNAFWEEINNDYANVTETGKGLSASVKGQIIDYLGFGKTVQEVADALHISTGAVTGVEVAHTKALAATEKHKLAVEALVTSMAGESKSLKDVSEALTVLIKQQKDGAEVDDSTKQKMVDNIEKLVKGHATLTAAQQKFYDANKTFSTGYQTSLEATQRLWDQYTQTVQKDGNETLAAQISGTNTWYDNEYATISKAAKTNESAWNELEALNALYYAKLKKNRDDYDKKYMQSLTANRDIEKAMDIELHDLVDKLMLDTYTQRRHAIDEWQANEEGKIDYNKADWIDAYNKIANVAKAKMAEVNLAQADAAAKAKAAAEKTQNAWEAAFKQFPDLVIKAMTGGGGLMGAMDAMGATLTKGLFSVGADGKPGGPLAGITSGIAGMFGKDGLGKMLGDTVSGMLPGIGAMIGPAIQMLMNIGGPSKEELAARKSFGDWQSQIDATATAEEKAKAGGDKLNLTLQVLADAYKKAGKSSDDAARDMQIALDGTHHSAEQVADALATINSTMADGQKIADAAATAEGSLADDVNARATAGIGSQAQYNIVAEATIGIFGDLVKKNGDVLGTINALGTSLDALKANENQFGAASKGAVDQLLGIRDAVQANKDVYDAVSANVKLMNDLQAASLMTKDEVTAFGDDAAQQFQKLKDRGVDSKTAMVTMQPELQKLYEYQQKFGTTTDEATQALLDQAKQAGIVGPQMEDVNQQLLNVLTQIRDVLRDSTAQAGAFAAAMQSAANTPPPNWQPPKDWGAGTTPLDGVPSFDNRPMERVTSAGYALLHPGDYVGVPQGRRGGSTTVIVQGSVIAERELADLVSNLQAAQFTQVGGAIPLNR